MIPYTVTIYGDKIRIVVPRGRWGMVVIDWKGMEGSFSYSFLSDSFLGIYLLKFIKLCT